MLSRSTCIRAMTPRVALTTLGLTSVSLSDISQSRVKKAYIAQTLRCHPDLHPDDPDATEKFRRLSEAFRVALKSLEMKMHAGGTVKNVSMDDSQSVLDALRRAIVTYHNCRDATRSGGGGEEEEGGAHHAEERLGAFYSHSLEYVSSVCQTEALAMQRVKLFCDELPEVLCGKSCALFEAVAFFNARYVEAMARCVLRFSKNLPIIVNRVVKGRKRYVRYTYNKANSGVGTGSRPHQQRIEEMAMKPLVLVGALLFSLKPTLTVDACASRCHEDSQTPPDSQEEVKSTCGAVSEREIKICEELKCTIYPSDSIGEITKKLGRWEAASYERLQLELAMVDTTALLSNMLDLHEHPLTVMHHLHLPREVSEKVSLTLQKLVCGFCYHCDEPTDDEAASGEGGRQVSEKRIADGIRRCRHLAGVTAPYIEGNIALTWNSKTPLVESAEEVAVGGEDGARWKCREKDEVNHDIVVARHMSCCTAEIIRFSVAVKLSKDIGEFLTRLIAAMESVQEEAESANSLLPLLLEVRKKVMNEEFIPQEMKPCCEEEIPCLKTRGKKEEETSTGMRNAPGEETKRYDATKEGMKLHIFADPVKNALREDNKEEETTGTIRYCYRGPIRCFPRIFSMSTAKELNYWQMLHENRVYLAQHAPAMNPINVYYNSMPHNSRQHAMHAEEDSFKEELIGGWIGEAEDGADDAVITDKELESSPVFREWLQDVVEQSSLSRECHRIASEAGVGYVMRDPALPLPQYLSFVKIFCAAAGVRGILESKASRTRTATAADTGLTIVVGTECDVRDGGRLLVPWWIDPSILLALLQDDAHGGGTRQIEDGAERISATSSI
ncbi:putative DNAJ-domain protein [Trypanosoma rangeli]|uniref:Putative DNAJ-domain protein n=1 Tax=Trypanosoma rangeli TaxID=5698 RepID=A0A422NQ56_TRYRA|nr:putative DNAJ-domain protein [Trypanosoma rangeli]RNF07595.1 putative DNAJ-domain protein [Trypanosoma rangeli]|eukprot:RNF07595.1 putative DNAJ-domain protein [Trypanosoma rangeli]